MKRWKEARRRPITYGFLPDELRNSIENPIELESAYVAVKAIVEHDGQSWYWTERWQVEEREVDEWKANGSRSGSMEDEEALAIIDRIIEKGGQPGK